MTEALLGIWWRWEEREGAEKGGPRDPGQSPDSHFSTPEQHVLPVTVATGVTREAGVSYNLKSSYSMKFQEVRSC